MLFRSPTVKIGISARIKDGFVLLTSAWLLIAVTAPARSTPAAMMAPLRLSICVFLTSFRCPFCFPALVISLDTGVRIGPLQIREQCLGEDHPHRCRNFCRIDGGAGADSHRAGFAHSAITLSFDDCSIFLYMV